MPGITSIIPPVKKTAVGRQLTVVVPQSVKIGRAKLPLSLVRPHTSRHPHLEVKAAASKLYTLNWPKITELVKNH
jgi:hypothetical protein